MNPFLVDRSKDAALKHKAQDQAEHNGEEKGDDEGEPAQRVHRVGADHHQIALRDVDDLELAQDQAEAERDQRRQADSQTKSSRICSQAFISWALPRPHAAVAVAGRLIHRPS